METTDLKRKEAKNTSLNERAKELNRKIKALTAEIKTLIHEKERTMNNLAKVTTRLRRIYHATGVCSHPVDEADPIVPGGRICFICQEPIL